jgi:uncharacterized protein (TIGR01777 family)
VRVVVTGSSGLIGSALVSSLEADGHTLVRLVRRRPMAPGEAQWDPGGGAIDVSALEGADAVVNLAGAGIGDRRWSAQRKRAIVDSRVRGTTLLSEAVARLDAPPAVMVSGSAIGYYGDRGDEELTEESGPGGGFLADVVQRWEEATKAAEAAGTRVVHLRSGIVLGARGGALGRMLPVFRLGLGGRLGSGRQWWSWITLADEVGVIRHALTTGALRGPVNATAPEPVTNAEFTRALGRVLGRPAVVAVPALALTAVLGREMAEETVLASQRALPARALATGYRFAHGDVEGGLRAVVAGDDQGR